MIKNPYGNKNQDARDAPWSILFLCWKGGKAGRSGLTGTGFCKVYYDSYDSHTTDGNGQIAGLDPGTYTVRVKAGASNYASENSDPVKIGAYQIKVTFYGRRGKI